MMIAPGKRKPSAQKAAEAAPATTA
jgi:hypothetical protein